MRKHTWWVLVGLLVLLTFTQLACITASTAEPRPEAERTATPTSGAGVPPAATSRPPDPEATSESACPGEDVVYQLDYVHKVVQDMPKAHVEHVAEPGAAFYFTIREEGTADTKGFDERVQVSITGTLDNCKLEGTGELSADVTGSCSQGRAKLHIAEHWERVSTTVTCPGKEPQSVSIEGFFSAPEDWFEFDLSLETDTAVLEADTGVLSIYYSWTISEYGLAVAPLVPD